VARPWRLRYKLGFGLALLVASVALLLGGSLYGLMSYVQTMDTTRQKLDEMQIVIQLRDEIQKTGSPDPAIDPDGTVTKFETEKAQIEQSAKKARGILEAYKITLRNQSIARGLDPDNGESESAQIVALEKAFNELDEAIARAAAASVDSKTPKRLIDDTDVKKAHAKLTQHSNELFLSLVGDANRSFDRSEANHRRALIIAGFATGLAVVLVLTLLYYFRVWVFQPIRELQAGVHRVHTGDFDHPIKLTSKDELEELANEFNAMTARLQGTYKDLAQQVNDRTRQLVRSERMVSVGFLAAGVAHEINNPLASIAFCAEALERRLQDLLVKAPADADVIEKYLKMMQQEAFRCKQITQKLLDFSRSGGKRESIDLNQLIQDVIEVAQVLPTSRAKRIVFQPNGYLVAPVSVPEVKGVVLNIVVNALESMEDGGQLAITLTNQGEFAEIAFTDSGCGMSAEVLENIFEPFFTRSRTGNGTGLGLATSHLIIDQHGGTISAASPGPGKGSTFTVQLPLRAVEVRPEPRDDPDALNRADILAFPGPRSAA